MKLPILLAALIIATPDSLFANRKVFSIRGGSRHIHSSSYSHCYPSFPSSYRRPYYYTRPGIHLSYTSTRPIYYSTRQYSEAPSHSLEVDVQHELRRLGYYRGPIDGDIGPASRSSIRAYQAAHRLRISGRIDSALIRSLGI